VARRSIAAPKTNQESATYHSSQIYDTVRLVEGSTDQAILERAWEKLNPAKPQFFEVRPALSHSAIRVTLNDGQVFSNNPQKKIIGLFDFDSAFNEWKRTWNNTHNIFQADVVKCLTRKRIAKPGWALLLPVPAFRSHLASEQMGGESALSIELLFEDACHLPNMIEQLPLPAAGASKPKMKDGMKQAFATHVAAQQAFASFKPIFDRLEEIRIAPL
jgi:hypothetical protein